MGTSKREYHQLSSGAPQHKSIMTPDVHIAGACFPIFVWVLTCIPLESEHTGL